MTIPVPLMHDHECRLHAVHASTQVHEASDRLSAAFWGDSDVSRRVHLQNAKAHLEKALSIVEAALEIPVP